MNTNHIKSYAPKARAEFMATVTKQAAKYGITKSAIEPAEIKGDVLLIGGRPLSVSTAKPRAALVETIQSKGFQQVMEQVAYSWFNRLCAVRYMELKDYLGHGRRVLSHPDNESGFQILEECLDIELPGLDQAKVRELKLDGTKDEELYRHLLLAQCHALHEAMPFLFEPLDDETELLLPDNLTKTDSLIRGLVQGIPEEDWSNIEIIGWLYQFYISEKKDEVIGKVVASVDIPAATQLFTPNWIVKYMVQNSLGAQWLATYPQSPLKAQMEYYIEPAEQTDEVNAHLARITPDKLNPEELTLIDPASGSGHILVEAYELFKIIYLERGYRQRDVPQLILEKNLFGLDIDERAAQLTGFALMMKGRADDRRLFERGVNLNVMALVDSADFDAEGLPKGFELSAYGLKPRDLTELKRLFEHATTFGSLIQVSEGLAEKLSPLRQLSEATSQDLFVSGALKRLGPLVQQATLLAAHYDAVVANPPYMGSKGMNAQLKKFARDCFSDAQNDLFACFIERGFTLAKTSGYNAMVTMQSWMFLSSFEKMRVRLLAEKTIRTMAHMSNGVMGIAFGTAATIQRNEALPDYIANYSYTSADDLSTQRVPAEFPVRNNRLRNAAQDKFKSIPGSPLAYWVSEMVGKAYSTNETISEVSVVCNGIKTGNVDLFIRAWPEVSSKSVGYRIANIEQANSSPCTWFPYHKGGDFRRWYGNLESVLRWKEGGDNIKNYSPNNSTPNSRIRPENNDFYFQSGTCWNAISSSYFSVRHLPDGCMFDIAGPALFPRKKGEAEIINGYLTSKVASFFMSIVNTTLNILVLDIKRLPLPTCWGEKPWREQVKNIVRATVAESRADWDAYERSWDFRSLPILTASSDPSPTLESSYTAWIAQNRDTIAEMKRLEEENNRLFIDAYGLADELTPDVPLSQITLTVNPAYRYGGKLSEEQLWTRFREDTMEELVSYAIGCMMGRYSLDAPGLIYAHSGNEGFDPGQYTSFPADDDGIIPLTDAEWFDDDAANRLLEFISVTWDKVHLEDNLNFLADNLSPKKNESSRETLRRYLCDKFFKDHMQTYKKRPIYWLFSSGKEKAFQCLVYLHRYNEGTLARMRTEYVLPLTSKLASHVKKLEHDVEGSSSTSEAKGLEKEISRLRKQQMELSTFDEKLRHYADQQIKLDLDDGVKVNYGKFGDLLAEVKAITGKPAN